MIPSLHSRRSRGLGLKSFRVGCFVLNVLGGLSHSSLSIEGTFSACWVSPSMHVVGEELRQRRLQTGQRERFTSVGQAGIGELIERRAGDHRYRSQRR